MPSWRCGSVCCVLTTVYILIVTLTTGAVGLAEGSTEAPDEGEATAGGSEDRRVSMITKLPATHNWTATPRSPGHWLDVTVAANLVSFGSVSETTMDFKVGIMLIQEWKDKRLQETLTGQNWLSLSPDVDVWLPHVDFKNTKSVHVYTYEKEAHQAVNKWISPSGLFNYQQEYSVTVKCLMDLRRYPLDTQTCTITLDGYEGIRLAWGYPGTFLNKNAPLASDITSLHSQFQLISVEMKSYVTSFKPYLPGKGCTYSTISCDYSAAETCFSTRLRSCVIRTDNPECGFCSRFAGDCTNHTRRCGLLDKAGHDQYIYTALEIQLQLQRRLSYHLLQLYIPSSAIVIMSWVSFWIDVGATPARVGLGITTVLTMTAQSGRTAKMPQVSYARAADVWLVACELFTCAVLIEFAFVNFMRRQERKRLARISSLEEVTEDGHTHLEGENDQSRSTKASIAKKMDYTCRVVFPLAFLIFNIVYWMMYLSSRDM